MMTPNNTEIVKASDTLLYKKAVETDNVGSIGKSSKCFDNSPPTIATPIPSDKKQDRLSIPIPAPVSYRCECFSNTRGDHGFNK